MTRARVARLATGVVAGGTAIGLLAWLLLAAGAQHVRPLLLVALAIAGLAVLVTVNELSRVIAPPLPMPRAEASDSMRPYADLFFLEYRLSWTDGQSDRFERRVRPLLVRLADERLRQQRGINRLLEPDRARQIVGEGLWQLMTGPELTGRAVPTIAAMSDLISAIEAI